MKPARWHSCHVLDARQARRRLWQFSRDGATARAGGDRTIQPEEPLPARQVGRTLRHLWQPQCNLAWLPAHQVFLRVLQLPPCEPKEVPGILELQIEKLSPLPLAQIVWSYQCLPAAEGAPPTAILILAPREAVEAFLGELETSGYLADRLELPALRELLITPMPPDASGVWIYPREEGTQSVALVAWWHAGQLQNLNLFPLPTGSAASQHLVELLKQIAWAGEMEGWLESNPPCHLVAEPTLAAELEPALREFAANQLTLEPAVDLPRLAAASASAAAAAVTSGSPEQANLVPTDFANRYRQQFVDRLWMRGLVAIGCIYVLGVLAYFATLRVFQFQKDRVDARVAQLSKAYTETLRLKAKVQVLQEQVNLKYAALECLRAAAETLPEEMTLTQLTFQRGKRLGLFGTVPPDQQPKVTTYNQALRAATANGQPLFNQVSTKSIQGATVGQGTRPMNWSIDCEINRNDL